MEGSLLHPQIDERGRHVFPIEQITNIQQRRMSQRSPATAVIDGMVAANAFREFANGKNDVDIVIANEVAPKKAEELFNHYMRRRGAFVIEPSDVEQLNLELRAGIGLEVAPIVDARTLIAAIQCLREQRVTPEQTRCQACLERGEAKPKQAILCAQCCNRRAKVTADHAIEDALRRDPARR